MRRSTQPGDFAWSSLLALAGCDGKPAAVPAYVPALPGQSPLVEIVTDRGALAANDNEQFRCVMQIDGIHKGFGLGTAACRIADRDGDGRDDFALGAFDAEASSEELYSFGLSPSSALGAVVVISSTGREIGRVLAEEASDGVGTQLTDLGDVDGDSIRDWALGVPDMSLSAIVFSALGESHLRVNGGVSGAEIVRIEGSPGWCTFGVIPARDGGSVPELLTCFPTGKSNRSVCTARPLRGGAGSRTIPTEKATIDQVVALDDLDGDGADDFALSEEDEDDVRLGHVFFHSGRTGKRLAHVSGEEKHGRFGLALCVTADIDGDGARDLLVSEPSFADLMGRVLCISSRSRQTLFDVPGWNDTSEFGISVIDLGDIDGDGRHEVVISAHGHNEPPHYHGRVGVFSIDASGASERARLPGSAAFALGDFDGDLRSEFATAAPYWPKPLEGGGRVWVFSWNAD